MIKDKFKFWCPIEKAQETVIDPTTGEEVMRLGGIASTSDEDSDGEFLDPKGFDVKPLAESGMVNWHHQAKGQPAAIIGEPSKVEIRPEGLYLETDLYPSSQIARDVWELAKTLEKDSKTRRLGYSIEGKVLKRKSNDKKSSDYNKIIKAVITGVAITHQPKNPQTFANIIKGEIDDDFDEDEVEEAVDTENAKALKKESVDKKLKNQTFSKSEIVERLFKDIPGISIEKAEEINLMIKKYVNMKKGKKSVTEEDISKAYQALGLQIEVGEDISKAEESEEDEDESVSKAEKTSKKMKTEESEEDEDESEEEEKEEVKKGGNGNRFDRIEKAIATSHQINSKYIKALGVMVKDVAQKAASIMSENVELKEIIKGQEDTISSLSERIESFGSQVPAPKSLSAARPVERTFAKGGGNEFSEQQEAAPRNQLSMSKNPHAVAELLDQATFSKGFDEEFSKACTSFEANKTLPSNIIARIKSECGFEIVK